MKVLHVIPSLSPIMGGSTQAIFNMVKALRRNGVDAEIATTNHNGHSLMKVPLDGRVEYAGIPVWFFQSFVLPMTGFIYSGDLGRWLRKHIRDYELLHNHYLFSFAPSYAGSVARSQRVPYIVRTLGHLSPWALEQSKAKKKLYMLLIERSNLNQAAAIHCTSEGEARDVSKLALQTPVVHIPLGVDEPRLIPEAKRKLRDRFKIPGNKPIVLFLARLHPKKRPDLLLHSLGRLLKDGYSSHLLLAGSGERAYTQYLEKLVRRLKLNGCTSFSGFASGEEKDLFLQGSDIFTLPSYSENFGISVAEAMAAGLPVIVTPDVQIAPEIAKEKAGLVVEGTADVFSGAMKQLLDSESLRRDMGSNGKRLTQRLYSWDINVRKIAALYTSIVERQPIPEELRA
ncbi:MAG: glycosyltransferase [Candidatus Omnitrophica bacterium]|nr:glycosyltransferase [Candidatus Omnitrophota bacterium]